MDDKTTTVVFDTRMVGVILFEAFANVKRPKGKTVEELVELLEDSLGEEELRRIRVASRRVMEYVSGQITAAGLETFEAPPAASLN